MDTILPEGFRSLLGAFRPCFTAPSHSNFVAITAGWLHCLGRRTVTAVALASGALGARHISVFHRFFGRARWTLDALGHVLFVLALAWVPASQPLVVLLDDTLARKGGKAISLASMHHDPLLSTAGKPFFSFGHVWVVLALGCPCLWATAGASPCPFSSASTRPASAAVGRIRQRTRPGRNARARTTPARARGQRSCNWRGR